MTVTSHEIALYPWPPTRASGNKPNDYYNPWPPTRLGLTNKQTNRLLYPWPPTRASGNNAHTTSSTFEPGEDAILANYFIACSLSTDQRDMITTFLQKVIYLSEQENYGMDIAQYCKIRLAQMYIGVSPDNPDSYKGDISQDDLKRCNNLLEHIEAKHKDMQPAAKCLYLIAYSDVYRLAGKFDEAREYTKQAEKTAMSKYHISLVEKRQFLLQ